MGPVDELVHRAGVDRPDDLVRAWRMVDGLFGFSFPSSYVSLVDQVGPGVWDGALFLAGPRQLLSSALFDVGQYRRNRDWVHHRSRWSRFGRRPHLLPPPAEVPNWPLWPETGGAVAVGNVNDLDLYLLRHLHTSTFAVGVMSRDGGFEERHEDLVDTVLAWLNGAPMMRPAPAAKTKPNAPAFAPYNSTIVVANLRPGDQPLAQRVDAMSRLIRDRYRQGPLWQSPRQLRSTKRQLHGPQLVSPFAIFAPDQADGDDHPIQHAHAPWQRLDFNLDGDQIAATGWYDDATDGSGRHRLCIAGDPDRVEQRTALLAELAAAMDTDITTTELI